MPNRIIREGILSSEKIASLDWAQEVFYRRIHSIVDDYGRHEANHQLLRSRCYPLQTDTVRVADIARWLTACETAGLILVYAVDGKQYLEVSNFGQQQRSASKCPEPPSDAQHLHGGCMASATHPLPLDVQLISIDSKRNQFLSDAHLGVAVSVVEGVIKEPIGSLSTRTKSERTFPDCPYKKLIELWAKHLPNLTQPRSWEGTRKTNMRNRWMQAAKPSAYSPQGYDSIESGLSWWESFFGYIATDTKLSAGFENNGRTWQPDLEWVVNASNFQKIIDGKYNK